MNSRVEVLAGQGLVIRFGEVTIWCGPEASASLIAFLIDNARKLSADPQSGHLMAVEILRVLANGDPEPAGPFVAIGPGPGGVELLLHGPARVWDGAQWLMAPSNPGWVHHSVTAVGLLLAGPAHFRPPQLADGSVADLVAGVVPGGGVALVPTPVAAPATPAVTSTSPVPSVVQVAAPAHPELAVPPEGGAAPGSKRRFVSVDLHNLAATERRDPLPVSVPPESESSNAALVQGISCSRGHFNNPGALYCSACGISMVHQTHILIRGRRPSLGVLVVDDGATFSLDNEYVVGTNPESDDAVTSGRARALRLVDAQNLVAQIHADVRLVEWEVHVFDRGTPGGTFLLPPNGSEWFRVAPGQAQVLTPGTRVAVGRRVLVYESHLRN